MSHNPLPLFCPSPISVFVNLFLSVIFTSFFLFLYISCISDNISICLFVWLISLSLIHSRFIHVVANGNVSFFYGYVIFHHICFVVQSPSRAKLLTTEERQASLSLITSRSLPNFMSIDSVMPYIQCKVPTVYMYHIFFIHSSLVGHIACFHIGATVNDAVNTGVHISFQISGFTLWIYS